ncbi:hypothetical protein [Kribbella sp. NPDC023855]|uniref:hypothetical protein n=1 Tax=Kribbella sp. NPDC023855 TaxID=3154698 RepID=UPI0033F189B5
MTAFTIFVVLMLIFGLSRKVTNAGDPAKRRERAQRLLERIQAQQAGNQPQMLQGQYSGPVQGQHPAQGQYPVPGQYPVQGQHLVPGQYPQGQYPVPGQHPVQGQFPAQVQYVAPVQAQFPPPGQWQYPAPPPPQHQPQHHQRADRTQHGRQPEHNFPAPNSPLERRVRELMTSGNEVPAIRLLCDEQDLGIIEAQKYARALVAPPGKASSGGAAGDAAVDSRFEADETDRYVGSAAFAESVFDLDRDENVWASGWVDQPDPEDRTDMDELWQSVRNAGRPANPTG